MEVDKAVKKQLHKGKEVAQSTKLVKLEKIDMSESSESFGELKGCRTLEGLDA